MSKYFEIAYDSAELVDKGNSLLEYSKNLGQSTRGMRDNYDTVQNVANTIAITADFMAIRAGDLGKLVVGHVGLQAGVISLVGAIKNFVIEVNVYAKKGVTTNEDLYWLLDKGLCPLLTSLGSVLAAFPSPLQKLRGGLLLV